MTSQYSDKKQIASKIPSKDVTLDEQKAANSEVIESISKGELMSPSSLEYGYRAKESPVRTKPKGCTTKVSKETHRANVSPSNQYLNSTTMRNNDISAEKSPKGFIFNSCTEDESKVINRAKDMSKSQNHKSHTSRDNGINAEDKPPKGIVSNSCSDDESKVINRTNDLPKSQNHKSHTNNKNKEIKKAKVLPSKYILESCTRKDCSLVAQVKCSPKESKTKVRKAEIVKAKIISKTSREIRAKKQEYYFDHEIFFELSFHEIVLFLRKYLNYSIFHRWKYKIIMLSEIKVKLSNKISQDSISGNF